MLRICLTDRKMKRGLTVGVDQEKGGQFLVLIILNSLCTMKYITSLHAFGVGFLNIARAIEDSCTIFQTCVSRQKRVVDVQLL